MRLKTLFRYFDSCRKRWSLGKNHLFDTENPVKSRLRVLRNKLGEKIERFTVCYRCKKCETTIYIELEKNGDQFVEKRSFVA